MWTHLSKWSLSTWGIKMEQTCSCHVKTLHQPPRHLGRTTVLRSRACQCPRQTGRHLVLPPRPPTPPPTRTAPMPVTAEQTRPWHSLTRRRRMEAMTAGQSPEPAASSGPPPTDCVSCLVSTGDPRPSQGPLEKTRLFMAVGIRGRKGGWDGVPSWELTRSCFTANLPLLHPSAIR